MSAPTIGIDINPDSAVKVDLDGDLLDKITARLDGNLLDKITAKLDGNLLDKITAKLDGNLLDKITAKLDGDLLKQVGVNLDGGLLDKINASVNAQAGFSASIKELAPLLLTLLWTEIPLVKVAMPHQYKLAFSIFGLEIFSLSLVGESKAVTARNPDGAAGGLHV